jgi:hypothetical protein
LYSGVQKVSHNVQAVYEVFAVAIKEYGAFQQPQNYGGLSRGSGAQRNDSAASLYSLVFSSLCAAKTNNLWTACGCRLAIRKVKNCLIGDF